MKAVRIGRKICREIRNKLWILVFLMVCFMYTLNIVPTVRLSRGQECKGSKVERALPIASPLQYCMKPLQQQHKIQCERLINGDVVYMKSLASLKFSRSNEGCNLTKLATNCTAFKTLHGYHHKRVTDDELKFPLAFGIKIHKDPIVAEQLLRAIYRPHNVYCIHVDLKANKIVSDPLQRLAKCFDNVYVIQEYRVIYSSIRQPLSDIACMKKAINTNINWKYYLILAGQEYFLKTNLETVRILKILNGTNDIETYPLPKHLYWRTNKSHPITKDSIQKASNISKPPFWHNISLFKGSSYGMFSRGFVKFILENKIAKDLLTWANDTYAPEEIIWPTLNAIPGAPGGYKVHVKHQDRDFISRAMLWSWDKIKCKGKYVRSVCVFSYKDLPYLASAPEVVANKFHSDYDQLALDCLEEWLHNKTMLGKLINMNWFYYRNVPHVKNTSLHL